VDVRLRNLEYDLTSSLKKVVFGFQSIDAVLAASNKPIQLTLFITPNTLPQQLANTKAAIEKVAQEIQSTSKNKFQFVVIDPTKDSKITPQMLADQYGIQAVPVSLFGNDTFFFHLFLQNGEKNQLIYPSTDMSEGEVRTAIEAALKRTASGFLKTVGIWGPSEEPKQDMYGQQQQPVATFRLVRQQLGQEYTVRQVELSSGQVPNDIDELVVIAPQNFTDKELFAIDQYLMRGGSMVIATNNYKLDLDLQGGLTLTPAKQGVNDLLKTYGIELTNSLVMDPQSDVFPATVMRQVGDTQIPEITPMYYPYFVDVRPNGMDTKNPITSNLMAVTLNWASPLNLDAAKMKGRTVSTLLSSSSQSYLFNPQAGTPAIDIQPNFEKYPENGFAIPGADEKLQSYPLAVAVTGSFESAFKGKPSPFQSQPVSDNKQGPPAPGEQPGNQNKIMTTSEKSPADTRLVVVSSSDFLNDSILELSARLTQDRFRNNLQFMQNTVDWGSEDLDLLTIRSRGTFTRVLKPLNDRTQNVIEITNYVVALAALLAIYFVWNLSKRNEKPLPLLPKRGDVIEK
ncbi:MAG: GldG family protein, partial [Chloroflexota bacterium]